MSLRCYSYRHASNLAMSPQIDGTTWSRARARVLCSRPVATPVRLLSMDTCCRLRPHFVSGSLRTLVGVIGYGYRVCRAVHSVLAVIDRADRYRGLHMWTTCCSSTAIATCIDRLACLCIRHNLRIQSGDAQKFPPAAANVRATNTHRLMTSTHSAHTVAEGQ